MGTNMLTCPLLQFSKHALSAYCRQGSVAKPAVHEAVGCFAD